MQNRILFGLAVTAVLFVGVLFVVKIVRAQALPICLNPAGHLIWSGTWSSSNVPITSATRDVFVPSNLWYNAGKWGIDVSPTTGALLELNGVMRLRPISITEGNYTADGMMYYDTGGRKFRCREGGTWKDCIAPSTQPSSPTIPFTIKDSAGNIVLEVNQK